MRKYPIKKTDFEMNLAPLIDIVFLLLIFFMVAATLNLNEVRATIQLPETDMVEAHENARVDLFIDKDGQIFLEKKEIQREDISDILQEYLLQKESNRVTVYADKEVDFQVIVNLLDMANQLGIDQMQFSLHHR